MNTLIIRHIPGGETPQFQLQQLGKCDSKATDPVNLSSPYKFPVLGIPNINLMNALRWYLEEFLKYPFSPNTERADRIQNSLQNWGIQVFDELFNNMEAASIYQKSIQEGFEKLCILISSDNSNVLSWPWEALHDKRIGFLAHICQIERRLNRVENPTPLPSNYNMDQVNILMVTARPYKGDVAYNFISRPLFEIIEEHQLPVKMEILRPPTFENLRERLRNKLNYFHILHFDGHGSYSVNPSDLDTNYTFKGKEGRLIFENENGKPNPIEACKLSVLLREHRIPMVVLNACQSAMVDDKADDPFAMIAAALIRSGIRSVVAMSYSLYVSGANAFLPEFYRILFETGNVVIAMRAGRQQMLLNNKRICARGRFPFQDWLVPVLYQQEPIGFSFAKSGTNTTTKIYPLNIENKHNNLLDSIPKLYNPFGFIGRDKEFLILERAIRKKTPAIVIHGLGGIGKTTLIHSFLHWLKKTEGLVNRPFWFSFQDIHSAEYVINRLGEKIFVSNFSQ